MEILKEFRSKHKETLDVVKDIIEKTNYNPEYTGHRPTNEQIQFVIDNLQRFVDQYPQAKLDMRMPFVNINHTCGTVHCHAGNYAVIALQDGRIIGSADFADGIKLMANDLGFSGMLDLSFWAYDNPDVWGNRYGDYMFLNKIAFESPTRPKGALNNQDIIDHWKEVLTRNF